MSTMYAVRGRPTGRGRPRGGLLHAVPVTDRTRSALCGARVGGALHPWPDDHLREGQLPEDHLPEDHRSEGHLPESRTCPECAALLVPGAA